MTDDIDRASDREQQLRDDALRNQARRAGLQGKTVGQSAKHCDECRAAVPLARQQAVPGVRLCVPCQAEKNDFTVEGPMTLAQLQFDFETVRWLVTAALGIYAWVIGRQSASAKELLDLRTRVTQLEAQIRQVPSQQQLHELVVHVERLAGSVGALNERNEAMRHSMNRVENHLLNSKE